MRGKSETSSPTLRWKGLAGLSGTGAILIAVIMALTPAAAAANANVIHGTPIIGDSFTQSGCAKEKVAKPGISLSTGAGHILMSGQAKMCKASLGGISVESEAYGDSELGVSETSKLHSAATTVNVTWNIHALLTNAIAGNVKNCAKIAPVQKYTGYGISVNSTGGSSTVYFNETEQFCYLEAFSEIYAETEVQDLTTGTYSYGFNFIADNDSYLEYENYSYSDNYTNPAWYYYNSSGGCAGCISSYGTNSTATLYSATSSSLVTGTWSAGDTLQITTYAYVFTEAYLEYAHGKAVAAINGSTGGNHIDLAGITVS